MLGTVLLMAVTMVTVSPAPKSEKLLVTYDFEYATTAFSLTRQDSAQRQDAWSPLNDKWDFDGQTIRRKDGEAFASVRFAIKADPRFHNRRYVVADHMGSESWVLYLPAFAAEHGETKLQFSKFPKNYILHCGSVSKTADTIFKIDTNKQSIVYLGPPSNIFSNELNLIAETDFPSDVAQIIQNAAIQTIKTLSLRWQTDLQTQPTLILTHNDLSSGSRWKGGALDDATIVMRLRGNFSLQSEELISELAKFAAHEIIHLWNAEIWISEVNSTQPWLHEGSAEYIASRLVLDQDNFEMATEQRLTRCIEQLDSAALDGSSGPLPSSLPYDCGFIVNWIAEAGIPHDDETDILDLWKTVFEQSGENGYNPGDFIEVIQAFSSPHATSFVSGLATNRGALLWLHSAKHLEALGISFQEIPSGSTYGPNLIKTALFNFLKTQCQGGYG